MSTEDTGAPNLDAMPRSELAEWAAAIARRPLNMARKLFPAKPAGYVKATRDLLAYADNLIEAQCFRERGAIAAAIEYEAVCERIYKKLPSFARW